MQEDMPSQETNCSSPPKQRTSRINATSSQSTRARGDSHYVEAMQALESSGGLADTQVHVPDRLDAMIIEGIEQDDELDRDSDNSGRRRKSSAPSAGGAKPDDGMRGSLELIDQAPAGRRDSLYKSAPDMCIDVEDTSYSFAALTRPWRCSYRTWCKRVTWRLFIELLGALLLLANQIAVIAVQAPPLVDPTLAVPHQSNNGTVTHKYGFADDAAELRGSLEVDLLRDLSLLILRPLYALAAARLVTILLGMAVRATQRLMPGALQLVLKSAFTYGCALPAIFFPAACGACLTLPFDKHAWRLLFSLPLFLPMALWLMAGGLSLVLLDAAVQLWQDQLTVHHYENRSQNAYLQQQALRKIAAAVRAADRRQLAPRPAGDQGPVGRDGSARWGNAMAVLQTQLEFLTGPLDFGSEMAEAATIGQARKRADRLFRSILRQLHLRVDGESPPAVDRDALVVWAYGSGPPPPPRLASDLFPYGTAVDREHFVKAVERSYKEQRLITASVASFDRLHGFLLRGLQVVWGVILLTVLLMLWGIDLLAWLLPVGSTVLVICTLAGGLTTDVISSFFFAYVTRPYDIGDRVGIATPGQTSALHSLVVKDIYLLRTHFLTANGESMMINNSTVKGMALTNYARSGKLTLQVTLMVPAAAPSAKITELTDAISEYVAEKASEWSAVTLMFGDALLDKGHLVLNIWPTSVFKAHEVVSIYAAKSRLLRFCHAYMQLANIEYVAPVQPYRESPPPTAVPGGGEHEQHAGGQAEPAALPFTAARPRW